MRNPWLFVALCAAITVAATVSFAQPDTLWTRTYGGSISDVAHSVQPTADGGYIAAGSTWSFGAGGLDFYLVKTNAQGDTLWTRTYGGSNHDEARSVRQTTDGGYIVAGYTTSFGAGAYDCYVVKTNGQGDTLWTRTYGRSYDDLASSVQPTADGGYILAGYTARFSGGGLDFYLVKTNDDGDTVWTHKYGGEGSDWAWSVQQTTDGGYIAAGITQSFGAGGHDFYLVKTNSQGDTLWTRTYGGNSADRALSVQQTTGGGYIVAGLTMSFGAGVEDIYLVKTNGQGDTLWTRTYGGSDSDWAWSVQQTADEGYIVAGATASFGAGAHDFFLVRTNSQGDSLWTRTCGGSGNDEAYSLQQTMDGGFLIAGKTASFGAGSDDFYLLKTGPDPVPTDDPFILPPSSFSLSAHPNPFNSSTTIFYDLPKAGHVSLRVFDLLGREVAVLKDGLAEAGTHHVTFDGSHLASGIYFARLDAGAFSQTQKLMLLK